MFGLRVTLSVARTISVFRDTQLNSFYVYPSEWKGRLVMISVFFFSAMPTVMHVRKLGFRVNKVTFNLNVFAPFSIAQNNTKRKRISSSGYSRACCF